MLFAEELGKNLDDTFVKEFQPTWQPRDKHNLLLNRLG